MAAKKRHIGWYCDLMTDIAALKSSYEIRAADAKKFCVRLAEQISELIASSNISLAVPIEARVKSWQSLADKIDQQKLEIRDVAELDDFVGLRIILLFRRDLEQVVQLISTSLKVTSAEDALDRLGVGMFGYQSVHLQVKIPKSWGQVPTLKDFAGLQALVQVRTAAQHIWAAASHLLQYKREASVPKPVLRSINRVAALLETVDLEFERALQERQSYVKEAPIEGPASDVNVLNVDLLRKILDDQRRTGMTMSRMISSWRSSVNTE